MTQLPDPLNGYPPANAASALPVRERPAYRVQVDSSACSLVELVAALIGGPKQVEIAQTLLSRFPSARQMAQANPHDLTQVSGIGEVATARLRAAFELGARAQAPDSDRLPIKSPGDAAALLMPRMAHLEQEHLVVLLLDTRNRVIGEPVTVYHGSLNTSLIRVAEVFREAIKANAAAILVAHNHPSGLCDPSPEDVAVTRALVEAGKLMDVELVDHLVLGHGRFVSLKERGLGF